VKPVEILHDRWGVPHIYAQSPEDLVFAQGYIHAQERLWQMDFNRRLVAGRLSEILGPVSLPLDRWMRILGLRRVAEQQESLYDEESLHILQAYAAGVNARLHQVKRAARLPVEFTLLRYAPEPWTPVDSMSWAKMMAWNLSVNWETEILRAQLVARLGAENAAELELLTIEDQPRIIPPGVDYSCISGDILKDAAGARRFSGPGAREGLGSNNWVIAPARSQTGMPLLANDMHLGLTAPAIWFENHLEAGEFQVTGVSFPGLPGVIAGHNRHVAWGFTNGFPDVQDLYIERLRRTEGGGVQFLFRDEWQDAKVIRESIGVKGREPVDVEVIVTRHGPVINDLAPNFCGEGPLALRWTALEPDNMVRALLGMNRAGSCLEFREALRHWAVPVQNTVYADTGGNIAYSFPGKVPIRAKGDGRVPAPGWTGEYEWTGYVPFEELPHLYNPPQGFIATANNRVVGDDYPYFLGYDHVSGNRARRIVEMIVAKDRLDVDDIRRMQLDQVSLAARAVTGALCRVQTGDPELAEVLRRMRAWDGRLSAASPEAALYEVFALRLIGRLLAGRLDRDLAACYAGKGITPVLAELSLLGERSREWVRKLLDEPDSPWFADSAIESAVDGQSSPRDTVLLQVLKETVESLKRSRGAEMDAWAWGKLHRLTFYHPLGSAKPLDRLFNRGPYPIGGDFDTVWASGSSLYDLNTEKIIGPPFRFIADLSDWNRSQSILVPGQSGHPASPHYDDNVRAWFEGQTHPMLFDRKAVEQETVARLVLEPAKER
jgi:penicillin amidase